MQNTFYKTIETPVGKLKITTGKDELFAIEFTEKTFDSENFVPDILNNTITQLQEYFDGKRFEFNLKLNPEGTDFQNKIWQLVQNIPFGETASYLEIAQLSGSANNTRAVGLANGKNPIPIIIPCHRIIGTTGKLTGYAGGLERKRWLLLHELSFKKQSGKLF